MRAYPYACVVLATALSALGCSGTLPRVPVIASPAEMSALAGEWSGDYSSGTTGRNGSIVFVLSAAADSAAGEVVMVPRAAASPLLRAPAASDAPAHLQRPVAEPLTIRFVRVEGSRVVGSWTPTSIPTAGAR